MMQSLVSGGLEEGLNERNSTMLMWVTQNFGGTSSIEQTFDYFTGYFSNDYAGYYAKGQAGDHFNYTYYGMVGIINLRTGVLKAFSGAPPTSVSQLLNYADEANQ
ncbi:MAG: hypothetical protein QNJ97_06055 [Myxococcota bacterium]|nr:hypothetical protein [Myxococcota bacterium]